LQKQNDWSKEDTNAIVQLVDGFSAAADAIDAKFPSNVIPRYRNRGLT
jgi:hypothetical protein